MSNPKQTWSGGSGKVYEYEIFPINIEFNPNQNGNYIFAKQTQTGWNTVYIGDGDIKARTESHKNNGCVTRKGATHVHTHINGSEVSKKQEESDLLARHIEAYEPTGCNVKIGG